MDEVSRVKNIKQRFENINTTNESNQVGKNTSQFKNYRVQEDIKIIKPPRCNLPSTTSKEVISSARPNIKRKPAFRRDKIPMRNNDLIDKTKSSVVSSRVHLFNKMDDLEHEDISSKVPNSTKPDAHLVSVSRSANDVTQLYSKMKKPIRNTKPRKPSSDTLNSENSVNDRRVIKSKLMNDGIKKIENKINKENDFSSINGHLMSDISDDLSDTLKRVLRSPLPPGPPPKKPPRTFTSTKPNVNDTRFNGNSNSSERKPRTSASHSESLVKIDLSASWLPKIQQPLRSKTESEIKLKKIENALIKHQKLIPSPKLTIRKTSLGNPPTQGTMEKCAGIHKNKRSLSDKGTFNQFTSCLSDLNCSNRSKSAQYFSAPFVPSSSTSGRNNRDCHIYEDPAVLNLSMTLPNKEVDDNLYYMSTPIDNIINPSERKGVTEAQNVNVKLNYVFGTQFSGEVNAKSQNDISIDNKIKFWMNEAYSKSWTKTSDASSDSDSVFSASQDELASHSKEEKQSVEQCDQLTISRKGYCQRVASRAVTRNQSILTQTVSDYKHLFECLLLIGLNLDARDEKVPYIKMKYPSNTNVPQSIEHMCFPDAHDWYNRSSERTTEEDLDEDRCYVIPLTNESGLRKYVYCRRIKPEGESFSLPLSYCILSGHKANEFYFAVLKEVENRHGQSEAEFWKFIKELYENRFPLKGQGIRITALLEEGKERMKDELLMRPCDTRLEDLRLAKTMAYLKINIFLLIFSSLLLERKVILLSSCISKLSTCVEGLQVALLPFEWQHTLITVVPSNVISVADLCDAPTPYLIGLLKPKNNPTHILSQLNNKIQVLVVDLDEKKTLRKVGDENTILPNHLAKGLKNALQLAHSSEMHTNNLLACEAFTRLFVTAIGHYRRYIILSGNDLNSKKTFQKEAFVKAAPSHQIRMFLEWFVETAAFAMFINMRLQNDSPSKGLFEQRCNEYFEEISKSKYEKNNKLNKTVKQIGDLIKDWTT